MVSHLTGVQKVKKNEKLRIAVIGLGAVTRNIHLPAYKTLSDKIEIVAGCDTNTDARRAARENFGVAEVFEDPCKMIAETSPDIVSICTPPALHVDQSRMALEEGCHIFCEKPLAEDLTSADELIAAAEAAGRFVVVNNQFPYMKIHLAAKRLLGTAEFGDLMFLRASQVFHPNQTTEAGWRGELKRRLCFEFGVHVFSLARFFFDEEPTALSASMPNPSGRFNSDALNLITLEFPRGRVALIELNRLSRGPERYLDMWLDGEQASIHTSIGGEISLGLGLNTRSRRPFLDVNFVKGGKAVLHNGAGSKVIAKDGLNPFASSTAYHFNNFVESIRNGTTPPGTAADNRRTLALVFAAYDAAETGRRVHLEDYLYPKTAPVSLNAAV